MGKDEEDKSVLSKAIGLLSSLLRQEPMEIREPLYIAGTEVDGHGDGYKDPVEGPRQLVKSILEARDLDRLQYSLFHEHRTHSFFLKSAYVTDKEETLSDGTVIPKDQPVAIIGFTNPAAYMARVEKRLKGLSIGARGVAEDVGDEVYKTLLSDIAKSDNPARVLSEFCFKHKAGHLAYTSESTGGAASLKNDYYEIIKGNYMLPKEHEDILADIGEEFTELEKAKKLAEAKEVEETAPSTSVESEASDAGVDNQTVNKGQDEMSVELQQEIAELKKQLKTEKLQKSFAKYELSDESVLALASATVELDEAGLSGVEKALDELVSSAKEKVEALEGEKEVLSKSLADASKEPSELEKKLSQEDGEADGAERTEPTKQEIAKANLAAAKKELRV